MGVVTYCVHPKRSFFFFRFFFRLITTIITETPSDANASVCKIDTVNVATIESLVGATTFRCDVSVLTVRQHANVNISHLHGKYCFGVVNMERWMPMYGTLIVSCRASFACYHLMHSLPLRTGITTLRGYNVDE